jgi:branched-subunit amino acid aminotransferase/4-amino-4-deoxychorismate lyase
MSSACLAWIDEPGPAGRWGDPDELALPLADRGLLLADGLFETVLVLAGEPRLLAEHLERWQHSARLLGLDAPPAMERVAALAEAAVSRSRIRSGALRLNWSRGVAAARGLRIPSHSRHRFWLQLHATTPCFAPVRVIVSPSERRCATSLLSRCKTFAYGSSIQARRQAEAVGADDALLESTAGGLCCGTAATLLVRQGGRWLTPPLASGCLPGVMRARALRLGLAAEAAAGEITAASLLGGEGALLLNSLGCRPICALAGVGLSGGADGTAAATAAASAAERLWHQLLGA